MSYSRLPLGAVLASLVLVLPCRANTLLVKADGTGDYPTIQAAIDAAVDGDEVHLVAGTYEGDGNRNVNFGGKAITVRSQSGDPATTTINLWIDGVTPVRAFSCDSGEGSSSILEGLTLTGGFVDDSNSPEAGIVWCASSSPTIRACIFSLNQGASIVSDGGAPTVTGCQFLSNYTVNGQTPGVDAWSGEIVIEDCFFRENCACGGGGPGAVRLAAGLVRGCTFVENGASLGGALQMGPGALVEDCTFTGDATFYKGPEGGGAVLAEGGTLRRCLFNRNHSARGGAIYVTGGSTVIESCTFVAFNLGSWGGVDGDAIYASEGCVLNLSDCIIAFGGDPCSGCSTIYLSAGALANVSCTNIFGNAGGDWEGAIAGYLGVDGNISADPLFCDADGSDFTLYPNSPCAPGNSHGCGLIGALPIGCGPVSVEATSWGRIKEMYR